MSARVRAYPGLAPFRGDPNDRRLYFGREREAQSLADLIVAERLVVLCGRSGIGKTSLIQAGILPRLGQRGLVPVTVRFPSTGDTPAAVVKTAVVAQAPDLAIPSAAPTLWELFSHDAQRMKFLLVFDQFEELFLNVPPAKRSEFIQDLADVVRRRVPEGRREEMMERIAALPEGDPERLGIVRMIYGSVDIDVRVLISMREDHLARLDELTRVLPNILANTHRLLPLDRVSARRAIVGPARANFPGKERFSFARGVVDQVLDFLEAAPSGGEGTTEGIHPAHLQVICAHIDERRRRDEARVVTKSHVGGAAGLANAIRRYYRGVLRRLPMVRPGRSARRWPNRHDFWLVHFPRAAVRRLCASGLRNGGQRTRLLLEQIEKRYGVSIDDLALIEDNRLVLADRIGNRTFYELAHDALVEPVRRDLRLRRAGQILLAMGLIAIMATVGNAIARRRAQDVWTDVAAEVARVEGPAARSRVIADHAQSDSSIELQGFDLRGITLEDTDVTATIDLTGADLTGAHFRNVVFQDATFNHAHLNQATLTGTTFGSSDLTCPMYGADFREARIEDVHFDDTDLQLSDFTGAVIVRSSFRGARVHGAKLAGAIGILDVDCSEIPWWLAAGWTAEQWRVLTGKCPPSAYRHRDIYRREIARWERMLSREWFPYERATIQNSIAFRKTVIELDPDAAIEIATRAIENLSPTRVEKWLFGPPPPDPNFGYIYDNRGFAFLVEGKVDAAIRDFMKCEEIAHHDDCRYHLDMAYTVLGRNREAEQWLSLAKSYQPTYERLPELQPRVRSH